MFEGHHKNQPVKEIPEFEVDARFSFSGNEVLRGKDFAQMDAAEMADAKKAIAQLQLPFDMVRTRRFKADAHGRCEVRAFFGQHRVTAGGKERIVELKPAEPKRQILFTQQ